MVTPLLLLFVFGIIEFGSILDSQQAVSYLTREGANIASRGTSLDTVLAVTLRNGESIDLENHGGAVVSRVLVDDGSTEIAQQVSSPGYSTASRFGATGDPVTAMEDLTLADGASVFVVEIFYERPMITPIMNFFDGTIPTVLYDRAVF
jgi:Flp pilus assembly protein TadG